MNNLTFTEYSAQFDSKLAFNNKQNSALYTAYLVHKITAKDIEVLVNYFPFIHGEEGDSKETLKENRKGSIYFTFYPNDEQVISFSKESIYDDLLSLTKLSSHTKLLYYINQMVVKRYPELNNSLFGNEKREYFHELISTLDYYIESNGVLYSRPQNRINSANFSQFIDVLLTDPLKEEFNKRHINLSNNIIKKYKM